MSDKNDINNIGGADGTRNATFDTPLRKLAHTDYIVGWICALNTEYVAAQVFLDERHEGPDYVSPNDNNDYTLGRVGSHNVVIAVLPQGEYGVSSATGVAKDMLHSFPNIRIGLMVGIGGGAPSLKHDIRLGDVVVSAPRGGNGGVFQYDFGKAVQGGGFHTTGFLNQPPTFLRTAVNGLQAEYEINGHQLEEAIDSILGKMPRLRRKYGRPQANSDRLYKSTVIHPSGTEEDCISSCGNDSSMLEQRVDRTEDEDNPGIHYGLIASGNQIMKDAIIRDKLIKEKDVLCFETEAAGLMNQFPCLVVRGICDYSDSHKNNKWQGYAAMTAAAYTKDLLYRIPLYKIEAEKKISDVLSIVQEGVDKLVNVQRNKDHQEILEWLTPIDYAHQQRDFMKIRQPDTGHWFLSSEEYQTWIESDKQTLFCPGVPGAGKTIMTAVVINNLYNRYKSDADIGISYLYCDYRRQNEQKAEDLVANLLKQLTQGRATMPDFIKTLYAEFRKKPERPSLRDLSEAMRSVCLLYSKVFIIVDALDECQTADSCRKSFLSEIFKLQEGTNVNFFATSRNIPDILEAFKQSSSLKISARDEDVQKYLAGNMERLPPFVLRNPELQNEIKTIISKVANGMFLIVRLHVDALVHLPTVGHVKQALQNLPKRLDVTYERAMERIETQGDAVQKLAKKVLCWLIYAKRVLSVAELQHAVAVEPKTKQLNEEFIPDKEILGSICAGLVAFDAESDAVRLAHYTIQEYFEREGKHWFQGAEADIATACITYISFDVFKDWMIDMRQSRRKFALYQYAVNFFGEHARAAPEASHLKQLVLNFLGNNAKVYHAGKMIEGTPPVPKAIHLAAFFGLESIIAHFLENGNDPNARVFLAETLHWAVEGECTGAMKLLIDHGAEINQQDDFHRQTPLFRACYRGKKNAVKWLLENGADAECANGLGTSALEIAVWNDREGIVKLLLENGADVKSPKNGSTLLYEAVYRTNEGIVKLLLEHGADAKYVDSHGRSLLTVAVNGGNEGIIRLLLDNGADVNIVVDGNSLLAGPVFRGNENIVRLLLENGADVNHVDNSGNSLLMVAIRGGKEGTVRLLLENGAGAGLGGNDRLPLRLAALNKNEGLVRLLLENGVSAGFESSLKWAYIDGNEDMVKLLREYGGRLGYNVSS